MARISSATNVDLEADHDRHAFLANDTVKSFSWRGVTVNVKDRETKAQKSILLNASGDVRQGRLPHIWLAFRAPGILVDGGFSRGAYGVYGTIRERKDYAAKRPRPSSQ